MSDKALERRQFLTGAGAVAAAVAAGPTLAVAQAEAFGDATGSAPSVQPHDRVALLCVLRSATAHG